jgi:hypothetical protein
MGFLNYIYKVWRLLKQTNKLNKIWPQKNFWFHCAAACLHFAKLARIFQGIRRAIWLLIHGVLELYLQCLTSVKTNKQIEQNMAPKKLLISLCCSLSSFCWVGSNLTRHKESNLAALTIRPQWVSITFLLTKQLFCTFCIIFDIHSTLRKPAGLKKGLKNSYDR